MSRGMFCSPAMTVRKANGQPFHTETTSRAQKLLSPMSQKAGLSPMPSWSWRTWLIRPLSRWNMNAHVMTAV